MNEMSHDKYDTKIQITAEWNDFFIIKNSNLLNCHDSMAERKFSEPTFSHNDKKCYNDCLQMSIAIKEHTIIPQHHSVFLKMRGQRVFQKGLPKFGIMLNLSN